jgi:hypothetical protein
MKSIFYHALYIQVANANPAFSEIMGRDIKRRAAQPLSRNIIKALLKDAGPVTKGGIHLPPNVIAWNFNEARTQQVAISIAQALSYYHDNQFLDAKSCVDIRLCLETKEVKEQYNILMQHRVHNSVSPEVFCYWSFQMKKELKLYALLFWESLLYCLTFKTDQEKYNGCVPLASASVMN